MAGIGIEQLMLNFKQSHHPVAEVLAEMGECVPPYFPGGGYIDN